MSLLSSGDWRLINQILLSLHSANADTLFEQFLESVKAVIPYSRSQICVPLYKNGKIRQYEYFSADIPKEHFQKYRDYYRPYDYVNWFVLTTDKTVFKETELMDEELRANSVFMKEWMAQLNIYYSAVVILKKDGREYAQIYLYRGKEEKDFSDKEMEILNILSEHLVIKSVSCFPNGVHGDILKETTYDTLPEISLTRREREILHLIQSGVLRSQLSSQLSIEESTLNKHFANIYAKLRINSFEQLMRIVKDL